MKILICGYRDWAIEIYEQWNKNIPLTIETKADLVTSKEELDQYLEERSLKPAFIFFLGWSWIVQENIINSNYCICSHPSDLPLFRGGTPIQNQVVNGALKSAVTLFKMDNKIDHGAILYKEFLNLDAELDTIFKNIKDSTYRGMLNIVSQYHRNKVVKETIQDHTVSTYYKRRTPAQSEVTLEDIQNHTAKEIFRKARVLGNPYPNAYIKCKDGTKLYLRKTTYDE